MKHLVTWHGPVRDVEYQVEANREEDAVAEVCCALCEGEEERLDGHEVEELE
jgi:hypothetical protein